jgi:hypothetical protein
VLTDVGLVLVFQPVSGIGVRIQAGEPLIPLTLSVNKRRIEKNILCVAEHQATPDFPERHGNVVFDCCDDSQTRK